MKDFQVMLAATVTNETDFSFPLIVSPKVDGFRGTIRDGRLRARSGKLVANVATDAFFSHRALEGFDGELIIGHPTAKNLFQATTSALRSERFDPKASLLVFDLIGDGGFEQRLKKLDAALAK